MKQVRNALVLSAAIVAAAAMPALAEERDPLATAGEHTDALPVDISIRIIGHPDDVSGSIDVEVHSEGTDRTTHVDLPPVRGGGEAGVPDEHASDTAFAHAGGAGGPDGDHPDFDVPVGGPPEDVPAGPPEDVTPEVAAVAEMPTDLPAADLPDLPTELPAAELPDVPAELPAADLPEVPADVPTDVAVDVPAASLPDVSAELPAELPTATLPDVPAELPADVPATAQGRP